MVWPEYIGLDPEPARALASTTTAWSGSVDAVLRRIQTAETLTGEPVGVQLPLDEVGTTSQRMASEITRAVDMVESYSVPLDLYSSTTMHAGSVDQAYRRMSAQGDNPQWQAAAQDGLIPGGPDAPVEVPVLDMSEANAAIALLAAEVERLNGSVEAGVTATSVTNRHAQAVAELNALARTVTLDEASDFGLAPGSWVSRDIAATAVEWQVPYDEATLLHRRSQILGDEPSVSGHLELISIATALTTLHQVGRLDQPHDNPVAEAGTGGRVNLGAFDGLVANRPERLDDPASLSDESLSLAIENWDATPGADAVHIFSGLVAERDARADAIDPTLSALQRDVRITAFTRQSLGLVPELATDQVVSDAAIAALVGDGLSTSSASQLLAYARERFPGNELAIFLALKEVFENGEELISTEQGHIPTAAEFEALATTLISETTDDVNLDFLRSIVSAYFVYANLANEATSQRELLAIADYAMSQGLDVSQVARHYFNLDANNPPLGHQASELNNPQVTEIRMKYDREQATIEALESSAWLSNEFESAHWLFERNQTNADAAATAYSAALRGEVADLFAARAEIESFVIDAVPVASAEEIQAQRDRLVQLAQIQFAVSLVGTDHFDPLDADQAVTLSRLYTYWDELLSYFGAEPDPSGYGQDPFQTELLASNWIPPVSIQEVERLLASHDGSPDGFLSAGLAKALRDILADPALVESLAPRGRDLHQDPDRTHLDFHRLQQASSEDFLADMTEPWADQVDGAKPGRGLDNTHVRSDWELWIEQAESDPTVPLLVVEAGREIIENHLYATSAMEVLHVTLALASLLATPHIRAMLIAIDAGLYLVEGDEASAGLSIAGTLLPTMTSRGIATAVSTSTAINDAMHPVPPAEADIIDLRNLVGDSDD